MRPPRRTGESNEKTQRKHGRDGWLRGGRGEKDQFNVAPGQTWLGLADTTLIKETMHVR